MKTFTQFLAEQGYNPGFSSPEVQKAFTWIMQNFHGANIDTLQELKSPNFPMKLMRKFGLSPHEVREPIEAAWSDLTGEELQ